MSNIAGKSYAINTVTPIKRCMVWVNKFIFWLGGTRLFNSKLSGLLTLSLIHYARWAIVRGKEFPHLDESQPKEDLKYGYEFFFSNFNGSWEQYIDSFSMAIPGGLNFFWFRNVKYPGSVPIEPFHDYIIFNQVWTNHYYNAYPMASTNDIKSAKRVREALLEFVGETRGADPAAFKKKYDQLVLGLQHHVSQMGPTPIVSLAAQAATERKRVEKLTTRHGT